MAKTKKIEKETQLQTLLKKSEFWIGLGVVAVFAGVSAGFLLNNTQKGEIGERGITATAVTPVISRTPNLSKAPNKNLRQITRLADTAGSYTVVEGDNYWKISKKVCGTGKYFLSISAQNNAQDLHAGDQLAADCSL